MILITISSDAGFHRSIAGALDGLLPWDAAWQLSYYEIDRLRAQDPGEKYLVFADFTDPKPALHVAHALDGRPEFALIASGAGSTRDELLQLMQAGVRDVLAGYKIEDVQNAARRAAAKLSFSGETPGDLYAFVPAKPGSGSTTIATYAAVAASRLTAQPTLLLDFDIRLGVTSFLVKAEGNHSILDALQQADHLDAGIWSSLVSECGSLHLIGSGPVDFSRPVPAERFDAVLQFAMRKYSLITVDLPGGMEEYECETLRRAKGIFLVCAPDIGSLHLARRKSGWLRTLGVANNVAVVLNRVEHRYALGVSDIERIIQMPVRYFVPAANAEISRAVEKGIPLEGNSPIAKQIVKIASDMVGVLPLAKKPSPARRFVEYFSISAAREARQS